MKRITITYTLSEIELLFSLVPFVVFAHRRGRDSPFRVGFAHYDELRRNPARYSADVLIFLRLFKPRWNETEQILNELSALRADFDRLVFFDDSAGSDSIHFEIFDSIDFCLKGKLSRDHSTFSRPLYGRHLFSDFYHSRGYVDDLPEIRPPARSDRDLRKLGISWNLGAGLYPAGRLISQRRVYQMSRHFAMRSRPEKMAWACEYLLGTQIARLRPEVDLSKRQRFIQSRFADGRYPNSIGAQRRIFLAEAERSPSHRTGPLAHKAYVEEMREAVAVLSPFGYGEICFRDFEAVLAGALLLKPDCSHLETWPDLYRDGAYVPLDWMAADLHEKTARVLDNPSFFNDVINGARALYATALSTLEERVTEVLQMCV